MSEWSLPIAGICVRTYSARSVSRPLRTPAPRRRVYYKFNSSERESVAKLLQRQWHTDKTYSRSRQLAPVWCSREPCLTDASYMLSIYVGSAYFQYGNDISLNCPIIQESKTHSQLRSFAHNSADISVLADAPHRVAVTTSANRLASAHTHTRADKSHGKPLTLISHRRHRRRRHRRRLRRLQSTIDVVSGCDDCKVKRFIRIFQHLVWLDNSAY